MAEDLRSSALCVRRIEFNLTSLEANSRQTPSIAGIEKLFGFGDDWFGWMNELAAMTVSWTKHCCLHAFVQSWEQGCYPKPRALPMWSLGKRRWWWQCEYRFSEQQSRHRNVSSKAKEIKRGHISSHWADLSSTIPEVLFLVVWLSTPFWWGLLSSASPRLDYYLSVEQKYTLWWT